MWLILIFYTSDPLIINPLMMWPGEPGQMRLLVSNLVVSLSVNVARGGIFAWGFHTSFEIQFLIAGGLGDRADYRSTLIYYAALVERNYYRST